MATHMTALHILPAFAAAASAPGQDASVVPSAKPELREGTVPLRTMSLLFCLAFSWAASALGQGYPEEASREVQSGTPEEEESRAEVIDEITVTAQKREDSLQEVAISIAVLTAEELESLAFKTSSEIAFRTPNLESKSLYASTNPTTFLRGVGVNDFNVNFNGAVGFYIDQVYLSSPSGQVFQLFDLERVEVLRGPQGSLYGKNTTGGAINFVSNKPSHQQSGYANLTFGRFDQLDLESAFNVPIRGPQNALRLAVVSDHRDGTTLNLFNGRQENSINATAARAQLRMVPSDSLLVSLKVHGGINRSRGRALHNRGLIDGADVLGYVEDPDPYKGAFNKDFGEEIDSLGGSLTLDWTGKVELTSITAYEETRRLTAVDADGSPNQMVEIDWGSDARQISQELRLTSIAGDRVRWLAGVFLFREELEVANDFDLFRELRPLFGFDPGHSIFFLEQRYSQDTVSYAPFGQLTYYLTTDMTLTVGGRLTHEEKDFALDTAFVEPDFSIPVIQGFNDSITSDELSGDVTLSYQVTADLLLFAKISRGFKSGGFNGGALFFPQEAEPVDPEFLTSFELGFKSMGFGNRLRVNATGFFYDATDLQVFNVKNVGGVPIQVLTNASDASILGLDLELQVRPVRGLRLDLGLGLLDTEYENFVLNDGTDFSGNRLISAPKWSLRGAVEYGSEVGPGYLAVRVDYKAQDDMFFDVSNAPRIATPGYGLVNARAAYEFERGRWGVALWGKNLTGKVYDIDILGLSDFGFDQVNIGDPRTYGIELLFRLR